MKTSKIFKTITIFVIGIIAVAIGCIVACNDDVGNEDHAIKEEIHAKGLPDGSVLIGEQRHGEIVCNINLDEFSNNLWQMTLTHVAEELEILDSNGVAELHMVLYNIDEETTEAYWFLLVKEQDRYYYAASVADNNLNIYCKAAPGCTQECYREYDKHQNFRACRCIKPKKKGCDEVPIPKGFLNTIQDVLYETSTPD